MNHTDHLQNYFAQHMYFSSSLLVIRIPITSKLALWVVLGVVLGCRKCARRMDMLYSTNWMIVDNQYEEKDKQ